MRLERGKGKTLDSPVYYVCKGVGLCVGKEAPRSLNHRGNRIGLLFRKVWTFEGDGGEKEKARQDSGCLAAWLES